MFTARVKTGSGSARPTSVTGPALSTELDTTWPLIRSASPLTAAVNTFSLRYECDGSDVFRQIRGLMSQHALWCSWRDDIKIVKLTLTRPTEGVGMLHNALQHDQLNQCESCNMLVFTSCLSSMILYLPQDYCGSAQSNGTFRVITENVPCGTTGTTCSKTIKIFLGVKKANNNKRQWFNGSLAEKVSEITTLTNSQFLSWF